MQERSEAERRVTTVPAAGFDECRPAGARSSSEGGSPSHTTNILTSFHLGESNVGGFCLGDFNLGYLQV